MRAVKQDRGTFPRAAWFVIGPPCQAHGIHFELTLAVDEPARRLAVELMKQGTTPERVILEACQERVDMKRAFDLDTNQMWRWLS